MNPLAKEVTVAARGPDEAASEVLFRDIRTSTLVDAAIESVVKPKTGHLLQLRDYYPTINRTTR